MTDFTEVQWRIGRHVGRTVYAQAGPEASDEDSLIGVLDTPEIAAEACKAHNYALAMRSGNSQVHGTAARID
jgi:hypothetical protein